MEKVAEAGAVTLRNAGRSILVEPRDDVAPLEPSTIAPASPAEVPPPQVSASEPQTDDETLPPSPMTLQDGIRAVQRAFSDSRNPPRWPMYVRQAKQFLRTAIDGFDERNYGFASVVDLLRAAGKDGVLRVERDRHGAIRAFPGPKLVRGVAVAVESAESAEEPVAAAITAAVEPEIVVEPVTEPPVTDAEVVEAAPPDPLVGEQPRRARGGKTKTAAKTTRTRGGTSKAPASRGRRTVRAKAAAADAGE
jgi:hypothetical protein